MPPIKSILTACALLASFAGGYWLADNGWQKKASKERAETATYIAQLSEQHRKKEHELAKNAEALDQKYTADLSAAEFVYGRKSLLRIPRTDTDRGG